MKNRSKKIKSVFLGLVFSIAIIGAWAAGTRLDGGDAVKASCIGLNWVQKDCKELDVKIRSTLCGGGSRKILMGQTKNKGDQCYYNAAGIAVPLTDVLQTLVERDRNGHVPTEKGPCDSGGPFGNCMIR